jgi:manganese/zinc/iron transport system permease protein
MFQQAERLFIELLLLFFSPEQINGALGDPRTVAILLGALISVAGGVLGVFLLLRGLSLTSDAISHTILLGIVLAFLILTGLLGLEADLNSPWLLIGAAMAGLGTVVLTEAIFRSGLVKEDAALGLAFPFLFAVSVLLVARYADDLHLDADSVLVGEIGVAWANTHSHCLDRCDPVEIRPDDPRAEVARVCLNCAAEGLSPRSPQAVFEATCANCGTYSAAEAWRLRLIDTPPSLIFFPKSLSVMGLIVLLNLLFVGVLYKELKLATFDAGLAAALGFRPGLLHYALMSLVSLTAVGAFDAVGAVLVVAFFIIPPAATYLLTDRLGGMILLSPVIGVLGAVTGYELARDNVLWLFRVSDILRLVDETIGLGGYTEWNSSISASMVLMLFFWFLGVWILAPQKGLLMHLARRRWQQQYFTAQMLLGHLYHHQEGPEAEAECSLQTLPEHLNWSRHKTAATVAQVRARNWAQVEAGRLVLTDQGRQQLLNFRHWGPS